MAIQVIENTKYLNLFILRNKLKPYEETSVGTYVENIFPIIFIKQLCILYITRLCAVLHATDVVSYAKHTAYRLPLATCSCTAASSNFTCRPHKISAFLNVSKINKLQ